MVGERHPVDRCDRSGVRPDRPRARSADEFERIGIAFLRHEARPGRGGVVEPNVAERGRCPDDELFARARGGDRRAHHRVEQIEHDVAVADRVERVARRGGETEHTRCGVAIERKRRSGQRGAAERAEARRVGHDGDEAFRRAREALRQRVEPQREQDGLRRLPVRRGGEQCLPLERDDGAIFAQCGDVQGEPCTVRRHVARIELERRRDLVVAAAPGVQPFPGFSGELAHARVDRAVHVFKRLPDRPCVERSVGDLGRHDVQCFGQNGRVVVGDDPAAAQGRNVPERTPRIIARDEQIVAKRRPERQKRSIRSGREPPTPLQPGHDFCYASCGVARFAASAAFAAPAATGRPQIWMKPPAAS